MTEAATLVVVEVFVSSADEDEGERRRVCVHEEAGSGAPVTKTLASIVEAAARRGRGADRQRQER